MYELKLKLLLKTLRLGLSGSYMEPFPWALTAGCVECPQLMVVP